MPDYEPSEQPRQSITARYARKSVAIIEPTTRIVRKPSAEAKDVGSSATPRVLPLKLTEAIEKDPAFRITSRDGRFWIDPVAGTALPIDGDDLSNVAKAFFRQHLELWRQHGSMELHEVIERRWRRDILSLLEHDKRRMTIFSRLPASEGQWINPYTGEVEPSVSRDNGQVTANTVKAMAKVLTTCRRAETGELLSREALRLIKIQHGYQDR
ncbi:MAG: hypothetical protein EA402_10555 [Planctomycetota bacterium]|nr:MAG: hypothetical protein EA402_10555 [Planctomycetota bacterium]